MYMSAYTAGIYVIILSKFVNIGNAQWQKLSEQERQLRLMKLKQQERKLRQENRYDELANILELNAVAESNLQGLLVDNKMKHEQRLQERLKKRKQVAKFKF